MAALTEGSIPASFGRSVDGIWRSSYETQKIETAEQKCRRLGNYCNSTNQKTVKFTICGDCDGRCMRCMRGSISSLLSLWFVLSGGCSFARFRNNCNLAILRNLWVQCRRSREVLLAILYQWAHDGKLWSCCATRRKNTLEHCVKMRNELGARNCRDAVRVHARDRTCDRAAENTAESRGVSLQSRFGPKIAPVLAPIPRPLSSPP